MQKIEMVSDATVAGKRVKKGVKMTVAVDLADKLIARGLAKADKGIPNVDRK